jgi:hypothetical protein
MKSFYELSPAKWAYEARSQAAYATGIERQSLLKLADEWEHLAREADTAALIS